MHRWPPAPRPHLIEPDSDDPVCHWYPLRSQAHHAAKANAVIDDITGASLEYRQLIKGKQHALWVRAFANKLGMLAQGVGTRRPTGANTIFFIRKAQARIHAHDWFCACPNSGRWSHSWSDHSLDYQQPQGVFPIRKSI
jgi:hypothetical protein